MSIANQDLIRISIVIATYNRIALLEKVINSLFEQTYPKDKYEIIIVDDGSIDGTNLLVKNLMKNSPCMLRLFRQENQGSSVARNYGVTKAEGEIIGFIDDDCIASSNWIEHAVPFFKDVHIGGVVGQTLPLGEIKNKIFMSSHCTIVTKEDVFYPTCNIFYLKKAFNEVHGFDSQLMRVEDLDLANRILKQGYKIVFGEDAVVKHKVWYLTPRAQLRRLRGHESRTLLYKKNPDLRKKKLLFGFVFKKHIYPIFSLTFFISLIVGGGYSKILLALVVLSYFFEHVLVDNRILLYPLRILLFPKNLFWDMIKVYYTIRGSIKYRTFVL